MSTPTSAAQALIEALKNPRLTAAERDALLLALQALHAPAVTSPEAVPPARRRPADKVERKAERSMRLTREAIAALPLPGKGDDYVYDTACPQLAVRLRSGGGRSYVVVMWDRERRRTAKVTLGKCDALTPEQARGKAQLIVARVAEGEDVRREPLESLTLADLIDKWYAVKKQSTRTADELKSQVLHYLGTLAHRRASEITREDIGNVHQWIATKARKRIRKSQQDGSVASVETGKAGLPATADKWMAIVSAIYTWGTGKGLVATNPAVGIGKAFNAKAAARTQYLKGDALLRFWAAMEADPDADARDALLLMLYSGQRRGNVLTMQWEAIDLEAGLWTVHADQTKQEAAQTTPLSAQARVILAQRYETAAGPWVFPASRGEGCMTETRPREAWARICAAAKLHNLRMHDLRHTAGSWLARLGASEAVRQKALGHQTPAMAARYSHLELDPVADAMQRYGDAIKAGGEAKPAKVVKLKKPSGR